MSFKNLTWQQVALCLGMLAATIAAYKLFGAEPAGLLLLVTSITNLMLGRETSPEKPQ